MRTQTLQVFTVKRWSHDNKTNRNYFSAPTHQGQMLNKNLNAKHMGNTDKDTQTRDLASHRRNACKLDPLLKARIVICECQKGLFIFFVLSYCEIISSVS